MRSAARAIYSEKPRLNIYISLSPTPSFRHYKKEFQMPEGVQAEHLRSSYSAQGILVRNK